MRPWKSTLLVFTLLVALSGCASMRPVAEVADRPPAFVPSRIRASAVVVMKQGDFSMAGRASILASAPGSFRIEAFGPFGYSMMLMASDGERLYIASDGNVEEHLWGAPGNPYPFEAADVFSFLTGGPRQMKAAASAQVTETRDRWGRLTEHVRTVDDKVAFRVSLDDYRDIGGAHIPFLISMEDGEQTLSIRYKEVEIDPALDEGLFMIGGHESKQVD